MQGGGPDGVGGAAAAAVLSIFYVLIVVPTWEKFTDIFSLLARTAVYIVVTGGQDKNLENNVRFCEKLDVYTAIN